MGMVQYFTWAGAPSPWLPVDRGRRHEYISFSRYLVALLTSLFPDTATNIPTNSFDSFGPYHTCKLEQQFA
ncbi:hypothetical protein LINGRAHAP2_LOCUS30336 [Linum grandiflorum]